MTPMRAVFVASMLYILAPKALMASEYWGTFSAGPYLEVINDDPRPLFRLQQDFTFDDPNGLEWLAPADTMVDGASIPKVFWSFVGGPLSGRYLPASVIHDHYVRVRTRTSFDTHRNFYYGMLANGVPEWKAWSMYMAVRIGGSHWRLERRIEATFECDAAGLCGTGWADGESSVELAGIELESVEGMSAGLSKLVAVSRTLLSTDGEFFDVTTDGPVPTSFETADAIANQLAIEINAARLGSFVEFTGQFGSWEGLTLDELEPWAIGLSETSAALPAFGEAGRDIPFQLSSTDLGGLIERFGYPSAPITYDIPE